MQEYWRIKQLATMASIAVVAHMSGWVMAPQAAAVFGIFIGVQVVSVLAKHIDFEKQFRTHIDDLFNPDSGEMVRMLSHTGFCALVVAWALAASFGAVVAALTGWLAGNIVFLKMWK